MKTTLSPAECLDRAEDYMLARPGAVEVIERGETSVVFECRPPFTTGEFVTLALAAIFTFGAGLLYLAFRVWFRQRVRLTAAPGSCGLTRVVISGKTEGLVEELRDWAERDLFKTSEIYRNAG